MAKTKKKKYEVKDKTQQTLKWDDLIMLYRDTNKSLLTGINALKDIGKEFGEVINNYKDVAETYIGTTNTFADLTTELNRILAMHSSKVETDEENKFEYKPYIGNVSADEKHQEVYLYTVMAYGGLSEKIISIVDNTTVTLLGRIKEITTELENAVKDQEEKEENGESK